MSEILAELIGEAQAMQAIHGCAFKLEFGPASAPAVINDLERILAGVIAKNGPKMTLEAIIAGGLKFMEKEIGGDPGTLTDAQQEEIQRVMRRVQGRHKPNKTPGSVAPRKRNRKKV